MLNPRSLRADISCELNAKSSRRSAASMEMKMKGQTGVREPVGAILGRI